MTSAVGILYVSVLCGNYVVNAVFLVNKLSFEILFSVISQAALMVGPQVGQRRHDSAEVGPALGQCWTDHQCCL